MSREGVYTAIDLGTTKVCTIIASVRSDGGLLVHGVGIEPTQGMHKGRVVDVEQAQAAVKLSLDRAQQEFGRQVSWAYLGVSGTHITCVNNSSVRKRDRNGASVTRQDLEELIQDSEPQVPPGKELLHHIPMSFVVDGFSGVRSPEGLDAETIEVRSHSVMGDAGSLGNLRSAVKACKISVRGLVLQPLAAAEAVLTQDEQELGVVLVDIGGGTSDIIVYREGNPWYTAVVPVGGFQFTRDLSVVLGGAPYALVEEMKLKFCHAMPSTVASNEEVPVPPFPGRQRPTISQRLLCETLRERVIETLELTIDKVRQAGLRELPPGGIVLTGGSASMPGLEKLARNVANAPVRIAAPRNIPGLPTALREPAYSASVGILLWGIKHHGEKRIYHGGKKVSNGQSSLVSRLLSMAKRQ